MEVPERDDPRDRIVIDHRPWGSFTRLAFNELCTVKLIEVSAGEALSLQYHHHRDELWMALDDGLEIQIDDVATLSKAGEFYLVPKGATHRVTAHATAGRFIEVAYGEFDEHDIVRLEDRYQR